MFMVIYFGESSILPACPRGAHIMNDPYSHMGSI